MGKAGETAKGTLGGAATGAGIGTIIMPGVGTAIGAGIGGLAGGIAGYFGSNNDADEQRKRLEQERLRILGRQAPQAGMASQAGLSGFRDNQQELVQRLDALSRGQGPSLAAEQMRAATDRNQAAQASFANSGRGGGMSAINASNNMGRLGAVAAQDSMAGRIAEQQGALSQLGGAINQGRTSDEASSQFNAQQQNFRDQANLEAKLRTMGLNDEQIRATLMQQQAQANQPTLGDQLMAGGAGSLAMIASQQKGGAQSGGMPGYPQWGNYRGGAGGMDMTMPQRPNFVLPGGPLTGPR